jgi:P-type conjugative transfer protein TrbJ
MKRFRKILALALALSQLTGTAVFAGGGGGGISGFATETTQMMNNAELVEQVGQLAEQIQHQITMIQDMLFNTLTIPDQLFGDVRGIYSSVKGIIGRTNGLAYNLANLDEELARRFKSYANLKSVSTTKDFSSEYRKIVDTEMETVRTTMKAVGVSFEELEDDAKTLEKLQGKARSAKGRNELVQATNQLLGFLAEDAMKLRHLQMMQAQMAGTAYEAERARDDLSNRRIEDFYKRGDEGGVNIPDESLIDRLGQ